ncbi:hypothetical protein Bcep1808_0266 [Burkholderia vietnamiensis G4]|uniref:Uncharacterized protein n=1 Tax=Burkholderia vietnamiensis (strain G4 / LMG 22486) TaxID=269482 RepID=A4JAH8_BURVG|nr:hypothetical protein Bcep1808_0266 [Burkholderia vietnamiensis G4]
MLRSINLAETTQHQSNLLHQGFKLGWYLMFFRHLMAVTAHHK